MRIRTIKPEFFTSERISQLTPLARLLFIGLWCCADCRGRLEDRPKRIKVWVLPYDDADVDALLDELEEQRFILRYNVVVGLPEEHHELALIQILGFEKHQRISGKETSYESELPKPTPGQLREALEKRLGSTREASGCFPESQERERERKGVHKPAISSPATASPVSVAESIYDAYPRKRARVAALRAINAAIRRGEDPADLLEKTKAFAASQSLTDPKFIPHPATWFNGQRYAEPITEAARPTDPGAQREGESFADWEKRILREVMR